jgi:hypothetical protein
MSSSPMAAVLATSGPIGLLCDVIDFQEVERCGRRVTPGRRDEIEADAAG